MKIRSRSLLLALTTLGASLASLPSLYGCGSSRPADETADNAAAVQAAVCSLEYKVASQWETGFTGDVSFTNPGPAALNGWDVSWEFTAGQKVTSAWDGQSTQSGATVHVTNPGWNAQVPAGGRVRFGFNGSSSGQNPTPKNFAINGVRCGDTPPDPKPDTKPDAGQTPDPTPNPDPVPSPSGKRVVGYYTAWSTYGRKYDVSNIPASKLTHINYAFANLSSEGECVLGDPYADTDKAFPGDTWDQGAPRGSFNQLNLLKKKNTNLKTLISIGGWTWSGKFSDVASTAAGRERFATSCVAFMQKYGFDGIDIDWEYPVSGGLPSNAYRPEDKGNYTLLLAAVRAKMNGIGDGKAHLLTIAAPAGPSIYVNLEMSKMAAYLDWFNVMTYDFHGGWESQANMNAPLAALPGDTTKFNQSDAMAAYLAGGVPAAKLVMGVPFYGRGWSGVGATNNGLLQSATGAPTGTWEPGVFDYKDLAANYVGKNGYVRHWSFAAKVPWLYNAQNGVFISYDDAESMGLKAEYIKQKGLGGAMFWELSGDDGTLLDTLNRKMQ